MRLLTSLFEGEDVLGDLVGPLVGIFVGAWVFRNKSNEVMYL
jgi:hypothetical protein